jgi:predicted RecA/RadA family phage recombinase
MAKALFIQDGQYEDYTPSAAVDAGDVVVMGDSRLGVATSAIAADALGALLTSGVVDLLKSGSTGPVFRVGEDVTWDVANELAIRGTVSCGVYAGKCIKAAGTSDTRVRVQLNAPSRFADMEWEDVTLAGGSKTLDMYDVGKVINVTTGHASYVVTLPAVAAGLEFVVRVGVSGQRVAVSPNASDKIMGPDTPGYDNKDRICAAANSLAGDFIHLRYGSADGWLIVAERGIWTRET